MEAEAVGTLLAGIGMIGGALGWSVRTYVKGEIETVHHQIETHVAEDKIIHEHVREQLETLNSKTDKLADMDDKLDRLLERR